MCRYNSRPFGVSMPPPTLSQTAITTSSIVMTIMPMNHMAPASLIFRTARLRHLNDYRGYHVGKMSICSGVAKGFFLQSQDGRIRFYNWQHTQARHDYLSPAAVTQRFCLNKSLPNPLASTRTDRTQILVAAITFDPAAQHARADGEPLLVRTHSRNQLPDW
jgi:hypothetical protein